MLADDPGSITDEVVLYRRTTWDKMGGRRGEPGSECWLTTKNFFTDAPLQEAERWGLGRVCMSVGVSTLLEDKYEKMLVDLPHMGLVSMTAGQLRRLAKGNGTPCPQGIMMVPTENEPWHAVVFDQTEPKRSTAACKAINDLCIVVVPLVC